ncbi:MAG: hypothetical protein AAFW89_04430 [Bacteroidota bacterium]
MTLLCLNSCELDLIGDSGGGDDPIPVYQTEILEIRMTPDTVAVNDTLLIECIIKDSLDTRFVFQWGLNEARIVPVNGRTDGSIIRWVASDIPDNDEARERIAIVAVDNGSIDSLKATKSFTIIVKRQGE